MLRECVYTDVVWSTYVVSGRVHAVLARALLAATFVDASSQSCQYW
jgi:hypothetical protein